MRSAPAVLIALFAVALVSLPAAPCLAAAPPVEVDINQGQTQPLPIAIAPMNGADARAQTIGADIARVISANLERSGYFKPLDPASFIERSVDTDVQPRFADWRAIAAQALVNGQAVIEPDGRLRVDFRLWDVFNEQQLLGLQFTATPEDWRRVAHKISDAVYKKLTGEDGYFDTRIVFVAESGPRTARTKRLEIMDQDGANPSYPTGAEGLEMTPRFSASGKMIAYTALSTSASRVYVLNVETGRQESLGNFAGMTFSPRFSPDGDHVAFSVDRGGNSDIFSIDLRSRALARLTSEPAIDTSPSWSPDGAKIVFNSDRGGSPQLYVMGADGSNPRRISFGQGRYTSPVWSPKGDYIAFTRQSGSSFHIGVMRADGSDERTLTTSYLDEGPAWAPNGRVLIFARESTPGAPHLWTVDISGRNVQPAPFQGQGSDPSWSPLLK